LRVVQRADCNRPQAWLVAVLQGDRAPVLTWSPVFCCPVRFVGQARSPDAVDQVRTNVQ
jgi:hypothetical protein